MLNWETSKTVTERPRGQCLLHLLFSLTFLFNPHQMPQQHPAAGSILKSVGLFSPCYTAPTTSSSGERASDWKAWKAASQVTVGQRKSKLRSEADVTHRNRNKTLPSHHWLVGMNPVFFQWSCFIFSAVRPALPTTQGLGLVQGIMAGKHLMAGALEPRHTLHSNSGFYLWCSSAFALQCHGGWLWCLVPALTYWKVPQEWNEMKSAYKKEVCNLVFITAQSMTV